jgi:hypothetical protein
MATYRINKPVAAAYALAAALVTGGGGYYYSANIDEWRYEAALLERDHQIRTALAEQLPLTREMAALAPGASYPAAPEIGLSLMGMPMGTVPVSMTEAFAEAEADLAREKLENQYRSCAILDYLREAHRVAVAAYDSTPERDQGLTVPLARHRAVAALKLPECKP